MKRFERQDSPYPRRVNELNTRNPLAPLPLLIRLCIHAFEAGALVVFIPSVPFLIRAVSQPPTAPMHLFQTIALSVFPIAYFGRLFRKRWGLGLAIAICLFVVVGLAILISTTLDPVSKNFEPASALGIGLMIIVVTVASYGYARLFAVCGRTKKDGRDERI